MVYSGSDGNGTLTLHLNPGSADVTFMRAYVNGMEVDAYGARGVVQDQVATNMTQNPRTTIPKGEIAVISFFIDPD